MWNLVQGRDERERETFVAICAESVNHVVRQTEWDCFRFFKRRTLDEVSGMIAKKVARISPDLVEETIEVDVESTTVAFFEEDILAVTIAKAKAFLSSGARRDRL